MVLHLFLPYVYVQFSGEISLLLLKCCFSIAITNLISPEHRASFVIKLPKLLNYLTFSVCF